jgi:leucyl-tRNA synthetase
MDGAWRFLNRVWRLADGCGGAAGGSRMSSDALDGVAKKMHQTIKKVTSDMEGGFKFNTAISGIMELVNELYKLTEDEQRSGVAAEAVKAVVILLAPFVPHICEEMWRMLGGKASVFSAPWPSFDPSLLVEEEATYVVQINGKVRSKLVLSMAAGEDEVKKAALDDPKVKEWTASKDIRKVIVVPKKLVSIVVS